MVATLITRRNHWNDLYYRDDPTIMGWELANEPHMPGDDSGNVLKVPRAELSCCRDPPQPWVAGKPSVAGFICTKDPNTCR